MTNKTGQLLTLLTILTTGILFAGIVQANGPTVLKNPYDGINWEAVQHYKANFHSHTVKSDGRAEPDELINMFADAGYNILAIADHDVNYRVREGERDPGPTHKTTWPWTRWIDEKPSQIWVYKGMQSSAFYPDLGDRGMLAVRANELSQTPHLLSLFNDCGYTSRDQTEDNRMSCIRDKDGLAFWAHPTFYVPGGSWEDRFFDNVTMQEAVDHYANYIKRYQSTLGIEFTPRGLGRELDVSMKLLDTMLARHYPDHDIFIVGNDDTHLTYVEDDALHNIILAEELTEESIKHALRNGHTIVARRIEGNPPRIKRIEVNEENRQIVVDIDRADEITWIKNGQKYATGNTIDYSGFPEAVLRFEFVSGGETFYSQAFYIAP